jgi:hypothetical protein
VLKKDDFLRLSVNFKDFIEKFLKKSLYKFLKLIEDLNQMKILSNEYEEDENMKELDVIEEGMEESFRDSIRKEDQSENGHQSKNNTFVDKQNILDDKSNDKNDDKNHDWDGKIN